MQMAKAKRKDEEAMVRKEAMQRRGMQRGEHTCHQMHGTGRKRQVEGRCVAMPGEQ